MSRIFIPAIIIACAGAYSGLAQADIVKCTDKEGRVTLTDLPCDAPTVVVRTDEHGSPILTDSGGSWSEVSYAEPQADVRVVNGVTRVTLPPGQFGPRSRREAYARMSRPAPARIFSTDAATLRAAHSTLSVLDGEPRRIAGH